MHLFAYPHYTSEVTQFIEQLKASRPELEKGQQEGRALLWEQRLDRDFQAKADSARVAQKPYVYQTLPDPH